MKMLERDIYSYFSNGNSIETFKLLVYKLDTGDAIFNIFPYIRLTDIDMDSRIVGLKIQSFVRSYDNDYDFKDTVENIVSRYTGEISDNFNDNSITTINVPDAGITIVHGSIHRFAKLGIFSVIITDNGGTKEFLIYPYIDKDECNVFTRSTSTNLPDKLLYEPFKYDTTVKLYDIDSLKTLPEFSKI